MAVVARRAACGKARQSGGFRTYDPNGPKAPGKPSAADGFQDPKGGENWVPNPNPGRGGSAWGWEDADGNVWCPTGQGGRAHGDPHWDIQGPGGKYGNMNPVGNTGPEISQRSL